MYKTDSSELSRSSTIRMGHQIPQSLLQKILQVDLRANNNDYQQLLIQQKEMQIRIDEAQQQSQQIMKKYNLQHHKIQKIKQIINKHKYDSDRKKQYLAKYYSKLEEKLKGSNGRPLMAKLQQLSNIMIDKYNKKQQEMKQSLKELQQELEECQKGKETLQKSKEKLSMLAQHINPNLLKSQQKFKNMDEKQQRAKKDKLLKQLNNLQKDKARLSEDRIFFENDLKILKELLNIQDKHQKHWQCIKNGIRKAFDIRVRIEMYKAAAGKQYSASLPEMKSLLNQRQHEKKVLQVQLAERKLKLNSVKQSNVKLIEKYSILEQKMMDQNKK